MKRTIERPTINPCHPTKTVIEQLRDMVALWDTQKSRTKPANYRRILGWNNDAQTKKGATLGYLTGIAYLAAYNLSGFVNLCPFARNCPDVCLVKQGRARDLKRINIARIAKTRFFVDDYYAFLARLAFDIHTLIRTALSGCWFFNTANTAGVHAKGVARLTGDFARLPRDFTGALAVSEYLPPIPPARVKSWPRLAATLSHW